MIDVCLLGCGGMMPLPYRHLTSLMVRCKGSSLLIDCGEGTQVALRRKGWSFKPIDTIAFTHFHGDHIGGLPGLLLTMGNADRTEPLTLIGPKGLPRVVGALRVIAPDLPFEIRYVEIEEDGQAFQLGEDLKITAFKVSHRVPCYGYSIQLDRAGKFDPNRAREKNIPLKYWNPLQKGNVITAEDGTSYTPDMVLGPPRKGIRVTYTTDTRPVRSIVENARGSDLFICEGMYGEEEKLQNAKEHKHMMIREAASLAREAEVKSLWLTHYSPSLVHPEDYLDQARAIFRGTCLGKDGKTAELVFEED